MPPSRRADVAGAGRLLTGIRGGPGNRTTADDVAAAVRHRAAVLALGGTGNGGAAHSIPVLADLSRLTAAPLADGVPVRTAAAVVGTGVAGATSVRSTADLVPTPVRDGSASLLLGSTVVGVQPAGGGASGSAAGVSVFVSLPLLCSFSPPLRLPLRWSLRLPLWRRFRVLRRCPGPASVSSTRRVARSRRAAGQSGGRADDGAYRTWKGTSRADQSAPGPWASVLLESCGYGGGQLPVRRSPSSIGRERVVVAAV